MHNWQPKNFSLLILVIISNYNPIPLECSSNIILRHAENLRRANVLVFTRRRTLNPQCCSPGKPRGLCVISVTPPLYGPQKCVISLHPPVFVMFIIGGMDSYTMTHSNYNIPLKFANSYIPIYIYMIYDCRNIYSISNSP